MKLININQLANYLGVHRHTARKKYAMYMDLKTSKTDFLTANDIAKLDDVELDFVLSRIK